MVFSAIPLLDMFKIDIIRRTRGHSWKLVRFKILNVSAIRTLESFFSHSVLSKWNMLDNDTVNIAKTNSFETKLEGARAGWAAEQEELERGFSSPTFRSGANFENSPPLFVPQKYKKYFTGPFWSHKRN